MKELPRSQAGRYAWRRHMKGILPWLPFSILPAFLYPIFVFAFAIPGKLDFWSMSFVAVLVIGMLLFIDKKTDRIDATWGDGARGEFVVGEELDKLHKEGFHVFHDWYSGRGNVDHFVVGPQGVFAIETKSWVGEISCNDGTLLRDGKPLSGKDPLKQAKGEAADVSRLIKESRDVSLWVSPILCFSRAELRSYEAVGGVMLSDIGSLRRVILEHPERYPARRVNSISYFLERHLQISAAAAPNSPPQKPGKWKKALRLDRIFLAFYATFIFALMMIFPDSTVTLFQKLADFFRLIDQAWDMFL